MKCNDCLKTITENYYEGNMEITKCEACQDEFYEHDSCIHNDI